MKPRALDLFCGAGGVSVGLERAGFDVTGVDIAPQPHHRGGRFIQADALTFSLEGYDFIWASPPCQAYSMLSKNTGTAHRHADLIPATRLLLSGAECLTAIENVPGSPLRTDLILCGSMFGLRVRRHRWFELSRFSAMALSCRHDYLAVYVVGNGTTQWYRRKHGRNAGKDEWAQAMGIDWMTKAELSQAIPPAYAQHIGEYALMAIRAKREAACS